MSNSSSFAAKQRVRICGQCGSDDISSAPFPGDKQCNACHVLGMPSDFPYVNKERWKKWIADGKPMKE